MGVLGEGATPGEGKDVGEVMAKAAQHAKQAHGMATIPPDVAKKAQAAIRDK